jgi:tetratricopeptide (TPR) repeat protein
MSIESLKQQARKHEQKEDWKKALDQYNKALAELARDEQVDIGLYNRVGDLHVRVGTLDQAVELYREAYLPNNAIAVCKKVIRNVPARHKAYLQIGQIRAEQGFLPDARANFLTYAERMVQAGDLDESFRALIEFCDLAPDDVGVRVTVADQMAANGREKEAIEQLRVAHRHLTQVGESGQAQELETKILAIDPEAEIGGLPGLEDFGEGAGAEDAGETAGFGDFALGGDAFGDAEESEAEVSFAEAAEEVAGEADSDEIGGDFGFEIDTDDDGSSADADVAAVEEDEAVELPMMSFDDGDEEEDEAVELPMMSFDDEEGGDDSEAPELASMEFKADLEEDEGAEAGEEPELVSMEFAADVEEDEGAALPTMDFVSEESETDDAEGSLELPTMDFAGAEEEGEVDVSTDDSDAGLSGLDLGASEEVEDALEEAAATEAPESPEAAPEEAVAGVTDEVSTGDDGGYVDLGAMILGGGSEEKSTRFTVAYEEPSGDEEADFAKMLSQFKEKVSENLDSSDVRAHYDLGTAYKEMGLLDEAISSFQSALRASAEHLPTYELMGQTFMEMGQPEAAVKSLERAIEVGSEVEDDLIGIYYHIGRAYEELENNDSAIEFYDRVFSLDINFADVTERLRELR